MSENSPCVKVGDTIANWLKPVFKVDSKSCCGLINTLNAWGPQLVKQHINAVTSVMLYEFKIPNHKKALAQLMLATAANYTMRANKDCEKNS